MPEDLPEFLKKTFFAKPSLIQQVEINGEIRQPLLADRRFQEHEHVFVHRLVVPN